MESHSSPARGLILILHPGKNRLIRSRPLPAFLAPPLRFLSSPRQQGAFCHFARQFAAGHSDSSTVNQNHTL